MLPTFSWFYLTSFHLISSEFEWIQAFFKLQSSPKTRIENRARQTKNRPQPRLSESSSQVFNLSLAWGGEGGLLTTAAWEYKGGNGSVCVAHIFKCRHSDISLKRRWDGREESKGERERREEDMTTPWTSASTLKSIYILYILYLYL